MQYIVTNRYGGKYCCYLLLFSVSEASRSSAVWMYSPSGYVQASTCYKVLRSSRTIGPVISKKGHSGCGVIQYSYSAVLTTYLITTCRALTERLGVAGQRNICGPKCCCQQHMRDEHAAPSRACPMMHSYQICCVIHSVRYPAMTQSPPVFFSFFKPPFLTDSQIL